MELMKPWPQGHNVRSPYGYRIHPISGKRKLHRGLDIGYDGDIYAPADGTVVHKGVNLNKSTGGGYTLRIKHDNPRVYTVYYHLREPSPLPIGTQVTTGQVIGHTGTTGASTGIHLHFETRKPPGTWGTDFDPMKILSIRHASENPVVTVMPDVNPESGMSAQDAHLKRMRDSWSRLIRYGGRGAFGTLGRFGGRR